MIKSEGFVMSGHAIFRRYPSSMLILCVQSWGAVVISNAICSQCASTLILCSCFLFRVSVWYVRCIDWPSGHAVLCVSVHLQRFFDCTEHFYSWMKQERNQTSKSDETGEKSNCAKMGSEVTANGITKAKDAIALTRIWTGTLGTRIDLPLE